MMTYNSYEEAKIANPESDIWASKIARCGRDNVYGTKVSMAEITNNYFKCNPADHCMTVEKFLKDGHKFVEGDIVLAFSGAVMEINSGDVNRIKNSTINKSSISLLGREYILRAAALNKPKRTKVEYVKCLVKYAWEAVKEHEESKNIFHCSDSDNLHDEYPICGYDMHVIGECVRDCELYRRIETEITERDEFVEAACSINEEIHGERRQYLIESLYDSGKFKLIEQDGE